MKQQSGPWSVFLLIFFAFFSLSLHAQQNIAINTDGSLPDPNAILDIKSFTKGILIPRTSTTSRNLMPKTKGLLVYDTTTNGFWYHNGTSWVSMQAPAAWALTGNKGTKDTLDFIGTSDSVSLTFRVNNKSSGKIDPKHNNTFLGYKSGLSDTAGRNNLAIGAIAASNNKTGYNLAAMGDSALYSNTSGSGNTAVGATADVLYGNLTNATAIGYGAKVDSSNKVVIGNNAVTLVQTGATVQSTGLLASSAGNKLDTSAIIEARSVTKGLLLPRLTAQQIFQIPIPAAGLIVYNTSKSKPAYFDGLTWRFFNDNELTVPGILPNATAICTYPGVCTIAACNTGYSDCDGVPGNGCEINVVTDINNCGLCGLSGASLPNVASASCVNGAIVINSCNAGFANCDGNPSNGCEVNLQTDVNNCGSCAYVVGQYPNSTAGCAAGVGTIVCNAGFANCDGVINNGCEVNLQTNINHCGLCSISGTGLPNVASASCVAGSIVINSCNPGFANCDGIASNGCEVNLQTNINNCGACGISGANLNNAASTACVAGVIVINSCTSGFANCNNQASDGCEVNLQNNVNNCGACGISGAGLPNVASVSCVAGAIYINSCNAGFADCDGNASNGCEVNLATNINHCGLCSISGAGLPNVASASCVAGVIVINSCNAGFANCDGIASNGCEVNLATNGNHCGTCSNACPAGKTCTAGACQ